MAARDVLTRPARICGTALIVITALMAAAWLPADFPHLLRQVLLLVWGIGAILVAERWLFAHALTKALHAVGFAFVRTRVLAIALVASVPMWTFLPLVAWTNGVVPALRPDWISLLAGVVLVNGITEEVIHRGFVSGHLRRGWSFAVSPPTHAVLIPESPRRGANSRANAIARPAPPSVTTHGGKTRTAGWYWFDRCPL